MHRQKESRMRRKDLPLVVLTTLAVAAIALVVVGSGVASGKQAARTQASGPSGVVGKSGGVIGKGGGFGEKYQAPASTLSHALFKATLLPSDKMARNISLAALGRSTKTVNYD